MGRTVTTFVEQVKQLEDKWSKFRRCLRTEDRIQFDRLLLSVRYHTPSATYQCSDDPREAVMLSILIDLQKRLAALEEKVKVSGDIELPALQLPLLGDSE
jgi:hypothetical protein